MMIQHFETMWQMPTTDLKIEILLEQTLCPQRRQTVKREALTFELLRLETLQQMANDQPRVWLRATKGRRHELALWLFTVAIGVAALGLHREALEILCVLPGVPGGAQGRLELLQELLLASEPVQMAG